MSTAAIDQVVQDNQRLAYKVAGRFYPKTMMDWDDICQLALIGLYKAAKGYDTTRGAAFSTYAYRVIFNEIARESKKFSKQSTSLQAIDYDAPDDNAAGDYNDTLDIVRLQLDDDEWTAVAMTVDGYTQSEIAKHMGISQSQVSRVFNSARTSVKEAAYNGSITC